MRHRVAVKDINTSQVADTAFALVFSPPLEYYTEEVRKEQHDGGPEGGGSVGSA